MDIPRGAAHQHLALDVSLCTYVATGMPVSKLCNYDPSDMRPTAFDDSWSKKLLKRPASGEPTRFLQLSFPSIAIC